MSTVEHAKDTATALPSNSHKTQLQSEQSDIGAPLWKIASSELYAEVRSITITGNISIRLHKET